MYGWRIRLFESNGYVRHDNNGMDIRRSKPYTGKLRRCKCGIWASRCKMDRYWRAMISSVLSIRGVA